MRGDRRQAAIQHALKVETLKQLAREIGISETLAAIGDAMGGREDKTASTLHHLATKSRKSHRSKVLAEIAQDMEKGHSQAKAVNAAAIRYRMDKGNPVELDTLKNEYRRWLREEKRSCARPADGA